MNNEYKLKINTLGFREVHPKPTIETLQRYYEKKYYQAEGGHYQKEYSNDELMYMRNEARLAAQTLQKYDVIVESLLDLGCGEGYFSDYFHQKGVQLKLVDFSSYGLETQNPHLIRFFSKSSIDESIEEQRLLGKTFDFINLDNVLEHVVDPIRLIGNVRDCMHNDSILRVEVPNDFSPFQSQLLDQNLCAESWVNVPEHLSYFDVESLKNLFRSQCFEIVSIQMSFPIEIYLANKLSNYSVDKSKGRDSHLARLQIVNHLAEFNIDGFLEYSEAASRLEFGRTIILYAKKMI